MTTIKISLTVSGALAENTTLVLPGDSEIGLDLTTAVLWDGANGNCVPTNFGTFHKSKYEKSVDFSGTATRSGSSQHVSMRDANYTVSKVF